MSIKELLRDRILVLDGAMGTMIQRYQLNEKDFRGERFKDLPGMMKGNNDMLVLTRPEIILAIHEAYLKAGADIIETNTFNATAISMQEYNLQDYVVEMNEEAAKLARQAADKYNLLTPHKPRFVAGAIGPTNKTSSMSPDVNNPAFRAVTFDDLEKSYEEQILGLIRGGVDLLLIETIFDTLNAKAALYAAHQAMHKIGKNLPIMLSVTISDVGGHTLSGQTLDAFLASIMHCDLLSVGLNCSFGAKDMKPFLKELSLNAPYYISAYPNAGLPNRFGEYDETPEVMLTQIKEFLDEKIVNIIGGCCGTTPAHIAVINEASEGMEPHKPILSKKKTLLSGLELLSIDTEKNFINIGERCNVAGSRKFLRLIKEQKYEEALTIARQQVEDGAQIIDINMDDAMLNAKDEMIVFLNLIASDPDICKVPIMIDSSRFEVIEAGLKCLQGKSVVNSISLKEGEEVFLSQAAKIKELGAAIVVMAFDEKGQADTFERRIEICERAYKLLTEKIGFNPYDIIFDPNILAIATGIKEHDNYSVDFINATKWIKTNLPGAKVSGGVSNLSFSFRGNNYIREVMHAVFLYHAIKAGMDMGIVNPATSITYDEIPTDLLILVEDVVLNRKANATENLIEIAESLKEKKTECSSKQINDDDLNKTVEDRLIWALRKGNTESLEKDLAEALSIYDSALAIIDGPLMKGMNIVGDLFGEGKMFLPQIVKTARTMKKAVEILQPVIEAQKTSDKNVTTAGKYLLATVKGDVHDIGKNIVSVILSCNNFEVIDLGVMVPTEEIVRTAIEEEVDFIGLSGLITPSLEEMCKVATALEKAGVTIPLMIGGATTSELHTAVKIAPNYSGPVFHLKDAARNPLLATQLLNPATKEQAIAYLQKEQELLRLSIQEKPKLLLFEEAVASKYQLDWDSYIIPVPEYLGIQTIPEIKIECLLPYINWTYFFHTWKLDGAFAQIANIDGCDACRASWLAHFPQEDRNKASEAMQLFKEANRMLNRLSSEIDITLKAKVGFFKAVADDYSIKIEHDNNTWVLPTLRQQKKSNNTVCKSLSDYIRPVNSQNNSDYIGSFIVTVGEDFALLLEKYKSEGDTYNSLLLQSLGDRLVEAASEWLHEKVRKEYWGYDFQEELTISDIKKGHYRGIRPAVGYPSLPDQSVNFVLNEILNYDEIGVRLTEHGAMYPHATVSGLYFAHPESKYFVIGDIGKDQKRKYAHLRGLDENELNHFLP